MENMCWLINLHLKAEHIMMKNHTDGGARFMRIEIKEGIKNRDFFHSSMSQKFEWRIYAHNNCRQISRAYCSRLMYIVCNRMRAHGVIYEMKNAVLDYNLSLAQQSS